MPALCFQAGEAMKPEEMRGTVYVGLDTELPSIMPYPRFLLKMDISHTAKLLYALMLDRTTLSQKNQWEDDGGGFTLSNPIAEMMDKSSMTVHNALNELDRAGLLERERRGFSAPSRLYVKVQPPAAFGRYKNVFLSDTELAELKAEYPDR